MCGIVGFVGNDNAVPVLLSALSRLEYRGYDSAGIAAFCGEEIKVCKAAGKLLNLIDKTQTVSFDDCLCGIGHTRWATHGKPDKTNAHPHHFGRYTLVHNGIVENEEQLKEKYFKSAQFYSQTDTEVIVRLLDYYASKGNSTPQALRRTMAELEGSYALAVLDSDNPGTIYAAKNKSPLLIGRGDGFNMLGSDEMAMLDKTNKFCEIHDMEYAVITNKNVEIYSFGAIAQERGFYISHQSVADAQKDGYPHYMLKEIEQQPTVVEKIANKYALPQNGFYIDDDVLSAIKTSGRIYIIACGTSHNAAVVGREYFEKICRKSTDVCIAGEFVHNPPLIAQNPFFIFLSQSGETADCTHALSKIKALGHSSLAITNVEGSTLARRAKWHMPLFAGPEISVASTKAYTAQLSVLYVLANAVSGANSGKVRDELCCVADLIKKACKLKNQYHFIAKDFFAKSNSCFYIGRSLDSFLCFEAALKLKEISYINANGISASELKHGTIALIDQSTPVVAFITQAKTALATRSNVEEVRARGARVVIVSSESVSDDDDFVVLPDAPELLMPLLAVVPAQYIAYYAALERGCDVDMPRNLAKSVTVE